MIRVVGVFERSAEQRHHHVADEFIERSLMFEYEVDHPREVLVQRSDDFLGFAALGHRGKSANVREEHGHVAARAAEARELGVRYQGIVHVLRHVLAEELLHLPLLAALDEVLIRDSAEEREG